MKHLRITTVVLILINLVLGWLVALAWSRGQARISEPARLSAPPLSLPDLAALNSVSMPSVDVATIREQAVFYSARSFYRPPAPATEVPLPDYEMAGTLQLADGKRVAFVRKKLDRSNRTLHVGDDLEGWLVQAIESDRVVVDHGEQIAELRGVPSVSGSGLIRGSTAPRTAQSGPRVLGAVGSGSLPLRTQLPLHGQAATVDAARLYRPPPPPDR